MPSESTCCHETRYRKDLAEAAPQAKQAVRRRLLEGGAGVSSIAGAGVGGVATTESWKLEPAIYECYGAVPA